MMDSIIIYLYLLCVVVHLFYWLGLFFRLQPNTAIRSSISDKHSIVICYKNEEDHLPSLIEQMQRQKANEVVLVNDFSTDSSASVVQLANVSKIKYVTAKINRSGKKAAQYEGVKASNFNNIVLTDADCSPASKLWSEYMCDGLQKSDICLGYAPMIKADNWISVFAQYETYLTGIQSLGYAQAGMPYMGVGRNMAINKKTALPILASMKDDSLASGDDDLLVQAVIKNGGSVKTMIHNEAFVYSRSPQSLKAYMSQKARHMTTSTSYSFIHQMLLGVFAGTHMMTFALLVVIAIFFQQHLIAALLILGTKWVLQLVVNHKLMTILDEKDLWIKFPLLDIATFVFYMVMTPYLFIKNKQQWS